VARRSIPEENIRSIQKSGRSYHITLPIQVVREFKWKEGQKVVVMKSASRRSGKEIVIKDWKR